MIVIQRNKLAVVFAHRADVVADCQRREGREHLILSDWPNDNPMRAAKRLDNMSDEIDSGEMPLKKYTKIHADARLTESQRKKLTDWLDAEAARLNSMTGK